MNTPFTDQEILIKGLKMGNERAYKYLFSLYYKDLVGYALSLTNSVAKAEDLVQEVMVRLWDLRGQLEIQSSVKAYLFKSVYNNFIQNYRKEKNQLQYLEDLTFFTIDEIINENDDLQKERINKVALMIETLPPKCKKIFLLSKKEGFIYREIGEILNISIKTVEAQISKAFSIIRKGV